MLMVQAGVQGCPPPAVHHLDAAGVPDRGEALHHPGAAAAVPPPRRGRVRACLPPEVLHSPGQGGPPGRPFSPVASL